MRIQFNGSPNPTIGVEVELQIINPETKNLVSGAPRILERVTDINRVKPELIASTIELNTDVCANIETVRSELSDRFRSLLALCDELGYELACAGTHPFSRWAEQDITPKDRYHLLVNRCQWPARPVDDLRAPCPRRGRERGKSDRDLQLAQHLYPALARVVGQLAVLRGGGNRPRVVPCEDLRESPHRRGCRIAC